MIRCSEMALKIKVVVGDEEDDGGGDGTAWTELRKEKNHPNPPKKQQSNPRPVCVPLRQSIGVYFKEYESRLSEKSLH